MLIGRHDDEDDLPRNSQDTALIGDPRNDENTFVSQLQLTMLKLHNTTVERVRAEPGLRRGSESVFETAPAHRALALPVGRRPRLPAPHGRSGHARLGPRREPARSPRCDWSIYHPKSATPYMPVEFAVAAYRFGHSQVRGRLHAEHPGPGPARVPAREDQRPRPEDQAVRGLPDPARLLDGGVASLLRAGRQQRRTRSCPGSSTPGSPGRWPPCPPRSVADRPSLIDRNLTRGARLALPSGQDVAAAMGIEPLTDAELELPDGGPAPLWYYVLLARPGCAPRAATSARSADGSWPRSSWGCSPGTRRRTCASKPTWRPFLGSESGSFSMPDLIRASGHGLEVTAGP